LPFKGARGNDPSKEQALRFASRSLQKAKDQRLASLREACKKQGTDASLRYAKLANEKFYSCANAKRWLAKTKADAITSRAPLLVFVTHTGYRLSRRAGF